MITRRAVPPALAALAAAALGGCSSGAAATPTPPPTPTTATYNVLITEPSQNINWSHGQLFGHWSCDSTVDPATRYQGAQDDLWTSVEAAKRAPVLRFEATCPSGALLTVQVDAAAQALDSRPTTLRCEVFDSAGQRVADEEVTRGLGTSDPVCRTVVPGLPQ